MKKIKIHFARNEKITTLERFMFYFTDELISDKLDPALLDALGDDAQLGKE